MYSFIKRTGISPIVTIVIAVTDKYQMLKVGDITGTLEAGKYADLFVINGNPLENIRTIDTKNMEVIMKEGAIVRE